MATLKELINESSIAKKELIASTVRMSKEMHSFIDELAEHLSLSKQAMMLKLIEEGINNAKDTLNLNEIGEHEKNCHFHLLNTNKGNNVEVHERMLKDQVAAAFNDPWKNNINRIEKGDVVFLYENGKGIVAYGSGTGKTLKRDHQGQKDSCYYQQLKGFTSLEEEPLSAKAIKNILGRNAVFLRTMIPLKDGQKILDELNSRSPKNG